MLSCLGSLMLMEIGGGSFFAEFIETKIMNDQNDDIQNKGSNTIKDPDDWTTGNEPMTGAQKSYLETLNGGKPLDENLTKAEASKRIEELKGQTDNIHEQPAGSNDANANAIRDPDDWKTGGERMTGAQRSYLKTLTDEAGEEFDENITKGEAAKQIDELQRKTGRGVDTNLPSS